jgi:TRAP-type uncharacterized transport system substrate-binding protein
LAAGRTVAAEEALRVFLTVSALVLAMTAAAVGMSYLALRPTVLKVAIPATDPLDQRVFGLAADLLRQQRAPIRLEPVTVDTTKDAMESLDNDRVHLAVMRSDSAIQGRTHTVLILRREAAVILAPKVGKVQKITDLQNATIGVTREGPLDGSLLTPVLEFYGITRERARYIALRGEEIWNAFQQKKVDAMIAVGPVTAKHMADAIADAARGVRGAIQFLEIEEADAIVKRIPALESIEIEQGAFGGRPPRPPESVTTVGYSIRLVTNTRTDTDTIAELVRQLYLIRQNLSASVPGAGLMEAPDVDEATSYLIHPGVRAYVNGEQRTWFDKYNDYIYLGLFLASGVGSVTVGMFSWMRNRNGHAPQVPVRRIEAALDAVRNAKTAEELDAAEQEEDEIFRFVLAMGAEGKLSTERIASVDLAMNELRSRIAARRAALG